MFVSWLEANGYTFCAFAQSTFTRSWAVKAKNKRLGVRPGWPDLAVILKNGKLLMIEMKRTSGGRLSEEQKNWIELLRAANILVEVTKGFEAAKAAVVEHEN